MAKRAFQRKSAEEKKEEVQHLLNQLEEGVQQFTYHPDKFKAVLAMQAMMPRYSFRNVLLIRAQKPDAHFVASFNKWKSYHRQIRKGEKALRILAPRFINERNKETGQDETKLIGYLTVPVFDVSQTEGEPLPIEQFKLKLDGESDEAIAIFEWVKTVAAEDNCPVIIGSGEGANGFYSITYHQIVIDDALSLNHRAKTAVHELVHSRVHRDCSEKVTSEERECVAEGVAFIVCSTFGLDTSSYSFEYVRGWSKDNGDSLMKYGAIIQQTAEGLIADFERVSDMDTPSEEVPADEKSIEVLSA